METGDQANLAYLLDALAVIEAAEGVLSRVPLLLGAAQAIREGIGARGYGYYRPDPAAVAAAADDARARLGRRPVRRRPGRRAGAGARRRGPRSRSASHPPGLTRAGPAHHPYTCPCAWCEPARRPEGGPAADRSRPTVKETP